MKTINAKATFKPAAKTIFRDIESSRLIASEILRTKEAKDQLPKNFVVKGYVLRTERPATPKPKTARWFEFNLAGKPLRAK